jgi:hypothetical protein
MSVVEVHCYKRWVHHLLVSHSEDDLVAPEVDMEEGMVGPEQVPDTELGREDNEDNQEAASVEDNLEWTSERIPEQAGAALVDSQVR